MTQIFLDGALHFPSPSICYRFVLTLILILCFVRWCSTIAQVIVMEKCWMTPGSWAPTVNLWSWFWAKSLSLLCGREWSSLWDQAKCLNLPATLRLLNRSTNIWLDNSLVFCVCSLFFSLLFSIRHCIHSCPSPSETSVLVRIPWKGRGTAVALRRSILITHLGTRTWMNFRPIHSPLSLLLSC